MKQIIRIVFILFLVSSCGSKNAVEELYEISAMPASPIEKIASETLAVSTESEVIKKKIIKDGRLGIEVSNLNKSKLNIDSLVKNLGGYYDNESLVNDAYASNYNLKIRVPSQNLEILIAKIENGEGEVSYKEIDARDVTEEFIDLETRFVNKQKYLTQYQVLLKSAKSIKEILDIQEKIRGLEEEIESTTGRLKYLNDLVDYSTLELNISQKKEFNYRPAHRASFFEKFKQSLARGWYGFVDFLLFLLSNWAILILFSALLYFWIKYRRKRKLKKEREKLLAEEQSK